MRWAGPVALVLALAVGTALSAGIIIVALDHRTDSALIIEPLAALAGTAVGAVAAYLGARGAAAAEAPAEVRPHFEDDSHHPEASRDTLDG